MYFASSARGRGVRLRSLATHCSSISSTSSMSGMIFTGNSVSGQPQPISSGVKPMTLEMMVQVGLAVLLQRLAGIGDGAHEAHDGAALLADRPGPARARAG